MKVFRVLLWLSSYLDLFCTQVDVSNVFLSADIDAEVYVYPPPGYPSAGCFKLNKCLYGLKQAPRLFYRTLAATLLSTALERVPCRPLAHWAAALSDSHFSKAR